MGCSILAATGHDDIAIIRWAEKQNRGKRYNGGRSITNSQSERLWLTVEFAPIEFNDKINNVGILSSSYMEEIYCGAVEGTEIS